MNSLPTKRLRYSLISNNHLTSSSSSSPHSTPSLTIKTQSTILAEKYLYLLQILKEMRYDIRRSYAGHWMSVMNYEVIQILSRFARIF
jgi:hypothetical protein